MCAGLEKCIQMEVSERRFPQDASICTSRHHFQKQQERIHTNISCLFGIKCKNNKRQAKQEEAELGEEEEEGEQEDEDDDYRT